MNEGIIKLQGGDVVGIERLSCGHFAGAQVTVLPGDGEKLVACAACLLRWVADQGGPVTRTKS